MKEKLENIDFGFFKSLLSSCIEGDLNSISMFQDIFGQDIYNFPIKVGRIEVERAADFYCYCFDKGRIFKRMMTHKGRCSIKTYQYLVLKDLFHEWSRTLSVDDNLVFSLDEPLDEDSGAKFIDFIQDKAFDPETLLVEDESYKRFNETLNKIPYPERIYLKIQLFIEIELTPEDIRIISIVSKRDIRDVLASLSNLEHSLIVKNEKLHEKEDGISKISSKIYSFERKIYAMRALNKYEEAEEIERKLLKRRLQKARSLPQHSPNYSAVSYRDIAEILKVSVGTVSKNVNRAKALLKNLYRCQT